MDTKKEIVKAGDAGVLVETNAKMIERVKSRVATIHKIYKEIMKEGKDGVGDYGLIVGCGKKPSLFKPGAEKLILAFNIAPIVSETMREFEKGHREYQIKITLKTPDGTILGEGVGCCSTMESKYRWRTGPKEFTGRAVPQQYWNMRKTDPIKAQELIGGPGHSTGKNPDHGDAWETCIQGERVENPDPADQYNTVLKMGKKRSLVDAVLTVLGASDIFTQDIEDMNLGQRGTGRARNEQSDDTTTTNAPKETIEIYRQAAKSKGKAVERELDKVIGSYLSDVVGKDLNDCNDDEAQGLVDYIKKHYDGKK